MQGLEFRFKAMHQMPKQSAFFKKRIDQLNRGLDLLLYGFSTYALPLVIALLLLLALATWRAEFPDPEP